MEKYTGKTTAKGSIPFFAGLDISIVEKPSDVRYEKIIKSFPDILRVQTNKAKVKTNVAYYKPTTGPPIAEKPRRLSVEKREATRKEIELLLERGWIHRSTSEWASPIHHAQKKGWILENGGRLRPFKQCHCSR